MHELCIAISIVDQVISELSTEKEGTVSAVHLRLGHLSGVDRAALMFCYSAACEGTLLEGSRLVIEEVPVILYCKICNLETRPPSIQRLTCPSCMDEATVLHGYELEIVQMELIA